MTDTQARAWIAHLVTYAGVIIMISALGSIDTDRRWSGEWPEDVPALLYAGYSATALLAIIAPWMRRRRGWTVASVAVALTTITTTATTQFGSHPLLVVGAAVPALLASLGLVIVGAVAGLER